MPNQTAKSKPAGAPAKASRQAHVAAAFPALPEGIHDLEGLRASLGEPDEGFRRLIFRNYTEEVFFEWGVTATSEDIVADVPRFLSSSLRILGSLSPARQALVMVPPQIFALLADEATTHATMALSHDDVTTGEAAAAKERADKLKKEMGTGVGMRDRVVGALRAAVGDAAISKIRGPASDASSPAALAKGLRAVKGLIHEIFEDGSEDDQAALQAFDIGPAWEADLEAKAKSIEEAAPATAATGKRVSKRTLDIHDGRVLVLMDTILRAFRLARRNDKAILMPELNRRQRRERRPRRPGHRREQEARLNRRTRWRLTTLTAAALRGAPPLSPTEEDVTTATHAMRTRLPRA